MDNHAGADTARSSGPVWDVYDELRTARLNVKYHSARLARIEKWNFGLEWTLAVTAPSSSVAGLWFWDTEFGGLAWKLLGAVAAVAAVTRPLVGLTKKIKSYEEVLSGYRSLDHDLFEIKVMISQKRAYDRELQAEFKKALRRKGVLAGKGPEAVINEKLRRQCFLDVQRELPDSQFFVPEVKHHAT